MWCRLDVFDCNLIYGCLFILLFVVVGYYFGFIYIVDCLLIYRLFACGWWVNLVCVFEVVVRLILVAVYL